MHTVTITRLADDTRDDAEYTIGGDHTDDPAVFKECKHSTCLNVNDPDPYYHDEVRHDETHIYWEGHWCVETDECPLAYVDNMNESVEDFDRLGMWPLEIEWDEDWTAAPYDDGSNDDA